MAKISVIVPIYGVEKYLRECLDSIVNQTLKDIEILLIDDGGKDNCPAIIDEYAQKDSRIIPIHKPNGGYGHSCNVGLEKATGEYIAIIEPDDFIDLNMFEDLYDLAKKNNADVVKSNFYENYDTLAYKAHKKRNWADQVEIPQEPFTIYECPYFLKFHPSIWTAIYRREFINNENIRFVEAPGAGWTDNLFQVQTLCLAQKIKYTDKAYYYWRMVNIDVANDLKDITIPFKRSQEIHQWLEDNSITNENILGCLFIRELFYTHTIIRAGYIKDFFKIVKEVGKLINLTKEQVIKENNCVKMGEFKAYKAIKKNTFMYCLKLKLHHIFYPIIRYLDYLSFYILCKLINKKIVFWGASIYLERFFDKFDLKKSNILGIIDKNSARWGEKIGNYVIYSPDELEKLAPEAVLLTIKNNNKNIYLCIKEYLQENHKNIKLLPNIFKN